MGFGDAIAAGLRAINGAAGVWVTYHRGDQAVLLRAPRSSVVVEIDRGDGVTVEAQRIDWLVPVDKLAFHGELVEPEAGDQMKELRGHKQYVHEVMALGTDTHARRIGPAETVWRIHTKVVAVE